MNDLFTASREHDLPPRWDGHPVEWLGWQSETKIFICPPPKPEPCTHCGSIANRAMNRGIITFTGLPRIGSKRYPNRLHIWAFRCNECKADQVWDTEQMWELDPTDYQDEGSWPVVGP